jgi:azurin
MLNRAVLSLVALPLFVPAACGDDDAAGKTGAASGIEPSGEEKSFTLEVGDTIGYDRSELRVGAGDEVTVTITHTGTLGVESMGHNFVLLKQGVDMSGFATAAQQAADQGYIPPGREGNVIAHTKLVGGGESDSVTFQAPKPGTYQFLCSFPGHWSGMNGVLIVEG